MPCASSSDLGSPGRTGPPSIDNDLHGIDKFLLNTLVSEDFHREVNLQYIISLKYLIPFFSDLSQ